jgi:hypothetical protein
LNPELSDLSFLPHLIDEDIYLIDNVSVIVIEEPLPKLETINLVKPEPVIVPKQEVKEVAPPQATPSPISAPPPLKTFKKVVILVGYPTGLPANVMDAITKIFTALQISLMDIEIVNVLDPSSKKVDDFTFSYLILMGGNGKNLAFLQSYTGTRNRYDLATHRGSKVFFSEAMDIYMKPENIELKKKFWTKLKEMFSIA